MVLPIVHHPAYVAPIPADHRFPMYKFARLIDVLRANGLAHSETLFQPMPAPRAWVELAHDAAYVAGICTQCLSDDMVRRIGLPLSAAVAERSLAATGGTVLTARLALEHGAAANTAGGSHHAAGPYGAGFCVFNDVAVAARVLLAEGRVRRLLVIDLDVHQGDGTAAIFQNDARVFTFSMHCASNYPARKIPGDLDIALDSGVEDEAYLTELDAHLHGLLDSIRPDLVFYNAGVDPHRDDRLGRLALSDAGLIARDRRVLNACLGRGVPVACVIGGGYDKDVVALARRHAYVHIAADEALRTHA